MATEQKQEGNQQNTSGDNASWLAEKYNEVKEHAKTYPYVWASNAVVFGGLGLWLPYRLRKLRMTEDRLRVLQQRLRELRQADEAVGTNSSAASAISVKPSGATHVDKPPKQSSGSFPLF